jgi:hypothetical protein
LPGKLPSHDGKEEESLLLIKREKREGAISSQTISEDPGGYKF